MGKKILSIILSLCVMFGGVFCPGYGCETVLADTEDDVKYIYTTTLSEFNEALGGGHKVKKDTIYLEHDVLLKDTAIRLHTNKSLNINFNGYKIIAKGYKNYYGDNYGVIHISAAKRECEVRLLGDGAIKVVADEGADRISAISIAYATGICDGNIVYRSNCGPGIRMDDAARLIFNDGIVKLDTPDRKVGLISAALLLESYSSMPVEINGGSIHSISGNGMDMLKNGSITLNGGTVGEVWFCWNLTVNGGKILRRIIMPEDEGVGGRIHIHGGTIKGKIELEGSVRFNDTVLPYAENSTVFQMDGGTIISDESVAVDLREANVDISGGNIITTKKNATAIRMVDCSGKITKVGITSKHKNGKYAILGKYEPVFEDEKTNQDLIQALTFTFGSGSELAPEFSGYQTSIKMNKNYRIYLKGIHKEKGLSL